jgi:tryptophan halogenase
MIKKVLVLGGGSAGFLAAIALKTKLPQLQVRVLRSKELGIIGVGEGTLVSVVSHLHGYLNLDPTAFARDVDPVWKLGVRYIWGPRPWFDYVFGFQMDSRYAMLPKMTGFYVDDDFRDIGIRTGLMSRNKAFLRRPDGRPDITNDVAYHLENEKFVEFLEAHARRIGVEVADATVLDVHTDDNGVAGLVLDGGAVKTADLYVDCSGFRSVLLGKALGEPYNSFKTSLFCDRAIVGGWDRGPDEPIQPYTVAETMDAGWCWRIDLTHRINRGYVYSSSFISDEDAEREYRAKNPKVTNSRVVKFVTGAYERAWVKNVVAVGNANGFVEPLQATAIAGICTTTQNLTAMLEDSDLDPGPAMRKLFNRRNAEDWLLLRRFLAMHYKFNTRSDTPFWQACRETTDLAGCEEAIEQYQENGPSNIWCGTVLNQRDQFGAEGYLSMLVGMKVPYRKRHVASPKEQAAWAAVKRAVANKTSAGVGVADTLAAIRSPGWQWPKGIYS